MGDAMTKHTAAPWHVGMPPPNGEQAIGAQNGMMVAIATTGVGIKEETLANARLIAAAPELLEALKTIFPNNLNMLNKNVADNTVIPMDFTYGELRKIAAAIAKATGEQT